MTSLNEISDKYKEFIKAVQKSSKLTKERSTALALFLASEKENGFKNLTKSLS